MSITTEEGVRPFKDVQPRTFTAWPLLATLSGVLGLAALFTENRPDGAPGFDYPFRTEDVLSTPHEIFRVSGILGYLTALSLLLLAAVWRHRVERRFPDSAAASVVTFGAVATSALTALAFGWRGALGNYLPGGMEENTYDASGLYVYYVMNDFSPYIATVPLLGSAFAMAWMAFGEGLISKPLGALAGLFAFALLMATVITGVPGLPAMILFGVAVAGVWLAVGRSVITRDLLA